MMEFYKRLFRRLCLFASASNSNAKQSPALARAVVVLVILLSSVGGVMAQAPKKISGKIVDDENQPVAGAGIRLKHSAGATTSDVNGFYQITASPSDTLQFTFIGYTTQERAVGSKSTINVMLPLTAANLDEVVVVGYGTQKKANLTGAVTTVKVDEVLGNRPVSSTSSLLQGTMPGLNVSIGTGEPGTTGSLNVRGATDINTGGNNIKAQQPFILVDNVPFDGPLNLIDPNDIETVTLLKDAGSAAIYGARSAFGVLLITTKKGVKNQEPKLSYNNNLTLSTPTELPSKVSPLRAIQAMKDQGTVAYYASGLDVDTWLDLATKYQADPSLYPEGYALLNGTRYPLAQTDVMRDLLGKASKQFLNNFAVSGGSEKTTYRLSAGTVSEDGIIVPESNTDWFHRYNLKSYLSTDIKKWLTVQLDAGYSNTNKSYPAADGFAGAVSFGPFVQLDDSININGANYVNGTPRNMVFQKVPTITKRDDIRLNGRAIVKPADGLTVTGEYTFDKLSRLATVYSKITTQVDARTFNVGTSGSGNFRKVTEATNYNAVNVFANYDKSIKKHNISLVLGFNEEESGFEQETIDRDGVISAEYPSINQATGTPVVSDDYEEYAVLGAFGRLNYAFAGKYLLGISGRYDASSKFPPNHHSGFFPSVSVGWSIMKEGFMDGKLPWLTEFKPRASFGSVGNQAVGSYLFLPTMDAGYASWLNDKVQVTTLSSPPLISSNFTWATVQTLNVGLDVGMFKNRLSANFDWYRRDTKDILYEGIQLPAVLGTHAPFQNVADLRSKGIELQLNWQDKIGKVGYRIAANLSDSRGKITRIKNEAGLLSQYYVGQEVGEIYGYTTDRLYTVDDFLPGTLNANLTGGTLKPGLPKMEGELPNPGDVMFVDYDDNGIINAGSSTLSDLGDRRIIGNSAPRYQYGINGGVSFKSFDFSFVITGVGKQDQWRANQLVFPNFYAFGTLYQGLEDYWTPTNTNSRWGRTYDQAGFNQKYNQIVQSKYLLNGANFRVRNLSLAYTLPSTFTRKFLVNRLQTFFSVENAFTFDHMPKGLDPDVTVAGVEGLEYPFMRLYSFGVNLSF